MDNRKLEAKIQAQLERANKAVEKAEASVNRMIDQCEAEAARLKRLQVRSINQAIRQDKRRQELLLKIDRATLEKLYRL